MSIRKGTTILATANATRNVDTIPTQSSGNLITSGGAWLALNDIAPAYSSSSTYAVGAKVIYNGQLYKCTTAISTAEAWNSAHWTAIKVSSEFATADDISNYIAPAYKSNQTYTKGTKVTYQGKLYNYINSTSSSGHLPTDTTYWDEVTVAGGYLDLGDGYQTVSGYKAFSGGIGCWGSLIVSGTVSFSNTFSNYKLYQYGPIVNGDGYYGLSVPSTTGWTANKTIATTNDIYEAITYSALKTLRNNSQLVKGKQYRITDYECTTITANTSSAGHQFDIIVVADDVNKLNENARACLHSGDTYFSGCKLDAWELKYCLDNDGNRFAWADGDGFVFAGVVYHRRKGSDYPGTSGTMPCCCWSSISGSSMYTFNDVVAVGDNIYSSPYSSSTPAGTVDSLYTSPYGKGVIYYMKDEFNNECPYDFKNILFTRLKALKVVPSGSPYSISTYSRDTSKDANGYYGWTSYSTTYYTNTESPSTSSTLYSNTSGSVLTTYVIKSVFSGYTDYYTFTNTNPSVSDASLTQYVYNNIIKERISSGAISLNFNVFYFSASGMGGMYINFNILDKGCYNNTFQYAYNNILDNNCYENEFNYSCTQNRLGSGCSNNYFGQSCTNNTFGPGCNYNRLPAYNTNINFMVGCSYNTFDYSSGYYSFGPYCSYNTIGSSCNYNIFGSYCTYNKLGNYNNNITLGAGCTYITLGDSSATINYCKNIIIDNGCSYIYLNSADTSASSSNYLQNVHVHLGVTGSSSSNRLTLTVSDRNLVYETSYKKDGSTEVLV